MALHFEPHTEDWFRSMASFRPDHATHTKRIIEAAGRTDVCGVCGDHPAQDFEIVGIDIPSDAPATIRLCDDCRKIRSSTQGETFKPWTARSHDA
jgi:hypothetical protein